MTVCTVPGCIVDHDPEHSKVRIADTYTPLQVSKIIAALNTEWREKLAAAEKVIAAAVKVADDWADYARRNDMSGGYTGDQIAAALRVALVAYREGKEEK